jgi:hypothetical protein
MPNGLGSSGRSPMAPGTSAASRLVGTCPTAQAGHVSATTGAGTQIPNPVGRVALPHLHARRHPPVLAKNPA